MTKSRTIITYGSIAGVVLVASLAVAVFGGSMHGVLGMAFGYLTMLIALSMVFVGVKKYRDVELGGVISFGSALLLGLGISLVASVFYVLGWEAYLYATDYSFATNYVDALIEAERQGGASPAELAASRESYAGFLSSYANPLYRLPMTFTEVAPVALLVTLISAALLRNSRFMPAMARPA